MSPRIRLVAPSGRERREIERAGIDRRFDISYDIDDASFFESKLYAADSSFDLGDHLECSVERLRGEGIDGLVSALDHPGSALAAFYADALDLPGPSPESVMRCQHKLESRKAQRRLVPDATPAFARLPVDRSGIGDPPLPFPFFIKPIKGRFSAFAQEIRDENTWRALATRRQEGRDLLPPKPFRDAFNALLHRLDGPFEGNADDLIAEGLLTGTQCTLDGLVHQGEVQILGIVDSIMYPGTISFARFQTPSLLPDEARRRMADIAERFMLGIGYDQGLFNIEFFYDPTDHRVSIIEVNPRLASGFADLYEKVHGTNLFEIAARLACGRDPGFSADSGHFACAASFVERVFEDRQVVSVPGATDIAEVRRRFPESRVEISARTGGRLSDVMQDMASFRIALVHLGGTDVADLESKHRQCMELLPFDLRPVEAEPSSSEWLDSENPKPTLPQGAPA